MKNYKALSWETHLSSLTLTPVVISLALQRLHKDAGMISTTAGILGLGRGKAFDELVPSSGVTWTSPSMTAKTTGVKDINLIRKDLNGKPLVNEMQSIGWFPSDCDKLPKF
ncbi:unnamed protein product [Arabis nemorensis]|uniref:Uncharacterized protein n=1 Tax=Arabis nemorensis TaxID=586526 RepID=A0A565B1Z3_9BRAS|nr:unnamed protein product [Arabis nemorensis]